MAPTPSEVWVELHYRYKGELFRFNLPITRGMKFLDGLRIDFSYTDVEGGRRLKLNLEPLGAVELESLILTGGLPFGDDVKSVFVNGYQSRTGSRERSPGEKISALNWPGRLLGLHLPGDAGFFPYTEKKGRFHGYSYAYIRYPEGLLFTGSLDESAGFTVIGLDVRKGLFTISKDVKGLTLAGNRSMLDLVIQEGSEEEVFDRYLNLRNDSPRPGPRALAWSTGRDNRGTLDEVKVRRSLATLRESRIPLDYFIIDDGWQAHTGDWSEPASGFPSGMASLTTEIRGSSYIPGIRFAPFVVGLESSIFRNRKDWLARDSRRRIRPAGRYGRHGGILYPLDLSRSDVREYIARTISRFRDDWGFGLIRADHLYAAALFPPAGKSRGEAMHDALNLLDSLKGDCVMEYSGVPLESAFGKGDYCRIGADTTPYWENLYLRNIHARERDSTLNALRSTVGRRQLDQRFFGASVDSFSLSSRSNSMEAPRRYTQMLLQYLLGSLSSVSDDISTYDADERAVFFSLFPAVYPEIDSVIESRRTVTVRYQVNGYYYVAISNLAERIRPFVLPEGEWFGAPGLKRRAHHVAGGARQVLRPGESRNYRLISEEEGNPFAGSDGHVFPGSEIASIRRVTGGWRILPAEGVLRDFRVWVKNEGGGPILINGTEAECSRTPFGLELASVLISLE